ETHGAWPGLVAVSTNVTRDQPSGRVRVSWNCGETWEREAVWTLEDAVIDDLAFTIRDGVAILFLATSVGLYELALSGDPSLLQVLVDEADQSLGFYAVAASIDPRGTIHVSVAARDRRGVYLSAAGGKPKTFSAIGLKGNDVRVLAVQRVGPRSFLWAGEAAASGLDAGPGCQRCELLDGPPDPDAWSAQSQGWDGGSCFAIAFAGPTVLAATHRAGVLWLDPPASAWARPELGCGLPLREKDRLFHPVAALATMPGRELTFAGGPAGLFATLDRRLYTRTGVSEYTNKVSLPATWLFCSGDHEIEVVSEDAS
ncbi:MAG TPA: hypothetical protein VFB75_15350, partial [Burkholderiales bacterium]|nr:hypothetical protein [Burkholderiales bacterium]